MRIGKGTIYKRGKKFAVAYWIGGNQRFKGGFKTKGAAETFLVEILNQKAKGQPLPANAHKLKIEDLFRLVISDYQNNQKASLDVLKIRINKHLIPYFSGLTVAEMNGAIIEEYKHQRILEKARPATINRELHILKRGYSLALEQNLIAFKLSIKNLKEDNIRTQTFSEAEIYTFCKHLPQDILSPVLFQWETGWRLPSEILTLTWNQIDFNEEIVCLERYKTKNDEPRIFPFTQRLSMLLNRQRELVNRIQKIRTTVIPWVFVRDTGRPLFDSNPPKASSYFRRKWKTACRKSGLVGRRPHDLRRSAAINRDNAGMSLRDNQLLGGWKRVQMLERYLQKRKEDLRKAVSNYDRARTVTEPLPLFESLKNQLPATNRKQRK
jgi:integrase